MLNSFQGRSISIFLQDEFYPLIINLESTCLFIVREPCSCSGFARGLFRQSGKHLTGSSVGRTAHTEARKPEFVDKNTTMEENIGEEYPDCYYTYFRMQNASQENAIFFISTKMSASGDMIRIAPGEQGTWGQMMEKMLWIDDNDVLVKNLDALGFVQLYFNVPPITEDNYHAITPDVDTCAQYSFFDPMTESQRGTPRSVGMGARRVPRPPERRALDFTGLPTRTIRRPCVRRLNAGQTGMRNDKDVLRRSAGQRLAPGILIFRAPKCMISVFPPLQKGS